MSPKKSDSFNFKRNNSTNSSNSSTRSAGVQNCRKKLQEQFEESSSVSNSSSPVDKNDFKSSCEVESTRNRSVMSVLSLNDTRKVLRNGAERITKTFNTVKTTFGTISQKFKISTKRRQILEEGPMTPNCHTPYTASKRILGRTPTKLYSPFSIESPYGSSTTYDKENLPIQQHVVKETGA